MEVKDLKYLAAYLIPCSAVFSIYSYGFWSFTTVVLVFCIIPVIEGIAPSNTSNLSEIEASTKATSVFFDILLYINVFIVYAVILYFGIQVKDSDFTNTELAGKILSLGIVLGSNGINVAHELGHKPGFLPQTVAKILLLPCFYMHFIIEHNFGHHLRVGTLEDPATSRLNENIFSFWWRSIREGFLSAWAIENTHLTKKSLQTLSFHNSMIKFMLFQVLYFITLLYFFSITIALYMFAAGLIGILLLETINYIEHYGLLRKLLPNGKYERVEVFHSWNSDHEVGRILLYELTRHSDHHYKSGKKYQVLDHKEESPQLPYGYPTSILLALVPPLWFAVMNPLVDQWRQQHLNA